MLSLRRRRIIISIGIIALFLCEFFLLVKSDFIIQRNSISGDVGEGHYAVWSNNARIWHSGEIPLWNPHLWGGYDDIGHIHEVFYPIMLILQMVFWDPSTQTLSYAIIGFYSAIHIVIFHIGLFCLCQKRSRSILAALAISSLGVFSACSLTTRWWFYIWGGISWIPLLIFFLERIYENDIPEHSTVNVAFSGLIFGMIILCATAQGTVMAVLIYFLIFGCIIGCMERDRSKALAVTGKFLMSGIIGSALGSIQLLSFIKTMMLGFRLINTEDGVMSFSTFTEMKAETTDLRALFGSYGGYLGISTILCVLIILGWGYLRNQQNHDHEIIIGKVVFTWGILYSVGLVVIDIAFYIPGLSGVRQPILYTPFIVIGGSILASNGYNYIKENISSNTLLRTGDNNLAFFAIIVLFISFLPINYLGPYDLAMKLIGIAGIIAVILLKENRIRKIIASITVLIVAITNVLCFTMPLKDDFTIDDAKQWINIVNEHVDAVLSEIDTNGDLKNGGRILQWSNAVVPNNVTGALGYYDCLAYINPSYKKTMANHLSCDMLKRVQLQNIDYIYTGSYAEESFVDGMNAALGREPYETKHSSYSTYDGGNESTLLVWDMKDLAQGNAWMVYDYQTYENDDSSETVYAMINSDECDLAKECLVNTKHINQPLTLKQGEYSITGEKLKANSFELDINTTENGILATSEIYYPGWKVYIDEKRSDILEVNYAFRGVMVPAGTHKIQFKYEPITFKTGAILSIAAAFTILLLILHGCIKQKRRKTNEQI